MIFPAPRQNNQYNQTPGVDQFLFGHSFGRQQQQQVNQSRLHPANISSLAAKGAGGLTKTLGNVQQVLQVIETTAPIVQQYAPMLKNLPALYRMMKAINSIDDDIEPNTDLDNEIEELAIELQEEKKENTNVTTSLQEKKRKGTGESKPLLFI